MSDRLSSCMNIPPVDGLGIKDNVPFVTVFANSPPTDAFVEILL